MSRAVMPTKGALEFRAMPGTPAEKAARFRRKKSAVYAWLSGASSPPKEVRDEIHAAGGPPPEAWDEVVGAVVDAPVRERHAVEPATPEAVSDEAAKMLASIRDLQDDVRDEADPIKRTRMVGELSGAI